MKKFILLFLCISVICVGCTRSKQDTNTITIWHWMTDRHETFEQLSAQYEIQTGIKVKFELFAPSEVYSKKITASAQARVLPDIFGILDKKQVFASYVKNGFIEDLTTAFEEDHFKWEKSLFEKALSVNRFEEGNSYGAPAGIYGVPLDVTNIQMLYNKKLLAKAGYSKPPRTFDEFLEVIATLKKMGIVGFVSGWGERWMIDVFALNYAFNIMGEEKVMATINGEVKYTDPDWIKVLDIFRQLRDSGGLIDGVVSKLNKYAEQDFALERAAFTFNGSWCVNVYGGMNPNLEYAPMLPPIINSKRPMSIQGGAGSSFVVNKNSKNKDGAVVFLKWLTQKEQQVYFARETKNLPSNRKALSSIDPILSEFTKGAEYTTHPSIWKYNEIDKVSEVFDKGIQSIIIGDKTPKQVAQEVQTLKDKLVERRLRRNRK
jgi:raffinose/stachyose/melibiose transport system substrate-binding protein